MDSGLIRPLTFISFKHEQIENAFRLMATGKHIGKVIVHMQNNNKIMSHPRSYFHPHKSYVLIGGLGGMGIEIATWMTERGARKFVISSRSGAKNSYQNYRIKSLEQQGVKVSIDTNDVSTSEGVALVLDNAAKLGPLGGIFNMALVLQDGLFKNQSSSSFEAVASGKALSTLELDRATRARGWKLDHFVVFSSIVAARGNPGQTNYGFANSYMERICEERRRDGLPGLAIQWGPIGDVGYFAESSITNQKRHTFGLKPQPLSSWISTLDLLLRRNCYGPTVSSFIYASSSQSNAVIKTKTKVDHVAHILGLENISKHNLNSTLFELGMNSIMASEIRQVLSSKEGDFTKFSGSIGHLTLAQIASLDKGVVEPMSIREQRQILLPFPKQTIRKLATLSKSQDVVFLIHAVDGNLSSLELLASQMEATVYGIECTREAPLESIEELSKFYVKEIKQIQSQGPYHLCGYSFGGVIAFEMALQLEGEGESVSSLLFLDTCPKWKQFFLELIKQWRLEDYPDSALNHFLVSHMEAEHGDVAKDLQTLQGLDEKLTYVAQRLKPLYAELSVEEIKELATAFSSRLIISYNYEPKGKVKCRAILIKCLKGMLAKISSDDYGINESCLDPVEIIGLNGTHHSFIDEPKELEIPSIINRIYSERFSNEIDLNFPKRYACVRGRRIVQQVQTYT